MSVSSGLRTKIVSLQTRRLWDEKKENLYGACVGARLK